MHIKKSAPTYPKPNAALCAPVKVLGNIGEIIYSSGSSPLSVLLEALRSEKTTCVYILRTQMLILFKCGELQN